jgi:hypothetical protein
MYRHGMALGTAKETAMAMVNGLVTRQAEMMAYNDISIFLMIIFIFCVPLILMIPVQKGRFDATVAVEM